MALNNLLKTVNVLVEETSMNTVDKLAVFLKEKIEFDSDMQELFDEFKTSLKTSLKNEAKGKKRGGKHLDSNKKKRQASVYNLFIKDKMAEIKQQQPELKGKELMKAAIEMWKARPEAVAKPTEGV